MIVLWAVVTNRPVRPGGRLKIVTWTLATRGAARRAHPRVQSRCRPVARGGGTGVMGPAGGAERAAAVPAVVGGGRVRGGAQRARTGRRPVAGAGSVGAPAGRRGPSDRRGRAARPIGEHPVPEL